MKTDGERNRSLTSACGSGKPLHVHDVGLRAAERRHDAEMLDRLQRQSQPGAFEQPRRERVEALVACVPVGRGQPPKRNRDVARVTSAPCAASALASSWSYHGVNAGGSARSTRTRSSVDACSFAAGTSFTATPNRRAGVRFSTRWSSWRPPTTPTCCACKRCLPGHSADSRSATSPRGRRSARCRSRERSAAHSPTSITACSARRSRARATRSSSRLGCARPHTGS